MGSWSEIRSHEGVAWVPLPDGWPDDTTGGLSTRLGGVSTGAWESLNLGTRTGDDARRIAENLRRLSAGTGIDLRRAARIRLQHGCETRCATEPGVLGSADVLVTRRGALPLALTVADCFPLLLCADRGGAALAHCGWRGVLAGVASAAVRELSLLSGASPHEMHAWVGPGIGSCCFTLPREAALRFPPASRAVDRHSGPPDRPRSYAIDLAGVLLAQLRAAGLSSERIRASGLCTACRPDLFYSHRRDQGRTGRMLAWIMSHTGEPGPR